MRKRPSAERGHSRLGDAMQYLKHAAFASGVFHHDGKGTIHACPQVGNHVVSWLFCRPRSVPLVAQWAKRLVIPWVKDGEGIAPRGQQAG